MRGPTKTAQLQLYSSVLGGNSISAWSTPRADSHKAEAALTQMSSHTRDITQLEWTERAELQDSNVHLRVRFEAPFLSPDMWQAQHCSFQMSSERFAAMPQSWVFSWVSPEGSCELSPERDWTEEGAHRKKAGREEPPKDCDRRFKRPQRSQEQEQPCLPYQFLQRCWAKFPTISSKVTFHWIHLQF